jgi:predicted RNA polymerase sigma factor
VGPAGEPILLLDQDRSRWDHLLIGRGLSALDRAQELGDVPGSYTLQAAIAACHARARSADETDWVKIAALYEGLGRIAPSPVVELNRAVAAGMAFGPDVGLQLVDRLEEASVLDGYHLLPAVRGDLLVRLGRADEAKKEFERAASLTRNVREREILLERARTETKRDGTTDNAIRDAAD